MNFPWLWVWRLPSEIVALPRCYAAQISTVWSKSLCVPDDQVHRDFLITLYLVTNILGATCRSHLFWNWPLKMGLIRCPETSVTNYHCTLRNITEEQSKGKAIYIEPRTDPFWLQEVEGCRIAGKSVREGGKVVSPTHRPPLSQGNIPGTHFC